MVVNETLMQFQADILGVPVIRPKVAETTALGACYAAGLATGFWSTEEELRENWFNRTFKMFQIFNPVQSNFYCRDF